jgi:hypothetical protein
VLLSVRAEKAVVEGVEVAVICIYASCISVRDEPAAPIATSQSTSLYGNRNPLNAAGELEGVVCDDRRLAVPTNRAAPVVVGHAQAGVVEAHRVRLVNQVDPDDDAGELLRGMPARDRFR